MEKKTGKSKIVSAQINTDINADKRGKHISVNQRDDNQHKSASIEWQAPEFEYNPKDVSWYWLSLIVAIILVAFSLWQSNFLFAVFVVIAWLIILSWASRFPTIWEFKMNDKGININLPSKKAINKFYAYTEIEGFDVHAGGEEYKELVFRVKSKFSPFLKINFHGTDEGKMKNFLAKFLPKKEYGESAADSLSKLIRF